MRNKERHFPGGQLRKTAKHFELTARVEGCGGFVQNQQLSVAQISPRQRDFLPLAAGKIYSLLEAAAQHLLVGSGQATNNILRHPLRGMQLKINAIENQSGISGVAERDVAKLDSLHDGSRRRQCVRLGANGWLHFKEGRQIGEKQRLVTNGRQCGENLLNVAAGLLNRSRQEYQLADRQRTCNRTPNYKYVGRIVTRGSNYS